MEDKVWNDCKGINKLISKLCRIDYNNIYKLLSSRMWLFFDRGFMYVIYCFYIDFVR